MWWLTALFASLASIAMVAWLNGNPSVLNGVIGAGVCTVLSAALALIERL